MVVHRVAEEDRGALAHTNRTQSGAPRVAGRTLGASRAVHRHCFWYMMGADGLKEKINRAIEGKKVGYTEMLSRYGDSYSKVTPDDAQEREKFLKAQAAIVAKINAPDGADIAKIVHSTGGGLRRVYTEIEKLRRMQA